MPEPKTPKPKTPRPKSSNPRGAPTKFTAEVRKTILTAVEIGNTMEDSCRAAGVGYSSMREWAIKNPDFSDELERAQAKARLRMVAVVVSVASRGNWQAAMTYLERRDPDHWGRRERIDVMMDVRTALRSLTADDAEFEAAVAEAERLVRIERS